MTEPDDAAFAGPRGAATDATRVAPLSTRREPVDAAAQVGSEGVADDPDATRVAPISVEPSVPDSATHSSWQRLGRLPGDAVVGIGTMLKGRFLLEREIGRGGMGVVYLARDERKVEARDRDPYIAVKVLNDEFRQHPHALIALQRESRRAQHLAHDHIVRVYDFDKDGAIVFMTMEYVQGSDLRSLIRARHGNGLPMAQAWPLIAGMGQALRRAHAAGIVHSDFKPGNVMVDENTVAKVFDFGIARAAKLAGADASDDRTLFDATSLGAMTPAYASPEMLDGREPAFADDVYAFGCVVYELLAGRHPFDKRTGAQAREQGLQPAPLPGLDRRGNRALRRALAFDARQRPDMATLLAQLRPRTRRERWLRRAGVGLLALALVVVVAAVLHLQRQRQQVAQVLDGLAPGSAQRFVDETRAARALAALDSDERQRLILDHSAALEAFSARPARRLLATRAGAARLRQRTAAVRIARALEAVLAAVGGASRRHPAAARSAAQRPGHAVEPGRRRGPVVRGPARQRRDADDAHPCARAGQRPGAATRTGTALRACAGGRARARRPHRRAALAGQRAQGVSRIDAVAGVCRPAQCRRRADQGRCTRWQGAGRGRGGVADRVDAYRRRGARCGEGSRSARADRGAAARSSAARRRGPADAGGCLSRPRSRIGAGGTLGRCGGDDPGGGVGGAGAVSAPGRRALCVRGRSAACGRHAGRSGDAGTARTRQAATGAGCGRLPPLRHRSRRPGALACRRRAAGASAAGRAADAAEYRRCVPHSWHRRQRTCLCG
ncbi:serine/threonine protein kinase [Xanthomonas translucens]|uniref:Protein kinase domain-containing protein n=1 Tax=Xanthomonas translucens pv. translucens TaxID=134875 RepID=A0ABW9KZX9_XANCT